MPETDRFDCKLCRRSNNVDDMVFCAVCQEWYHYQCVGVTSAVANESWMCARCSALPSSTRIGELFGSDPVFPATGINVPSPRTTEPPSAVAPTSSVVSHVTNAGLPQATSAAFSTVSSTVPPGLVPSAVAGPSGWVPATTTTATTTNYGLPLLTEQARASLQWVQDHRAFLEQQLEESHRKELERKKALLGQLTNNALQSVISGVASNSFNEQSAAAGGVDNVGGWLGRMIGEMENLSVTPASAGPQVPASLAPVLNSSTPTTSGSASQCLFDPSLSSLLLGVPSSMTKVPTGSLYEGQYTTMPPIPLCGYSPPGADHSRQISAFPTSTQASLMGLGNANLTSVVTACPTVPTASIPQVPVYGGLLGSASVPRLQPNPIVSQSPMGGYYSVNSTQAIPLQYPMSPTQQQLLARQVMPRDLPPFRGDPEDWPLFFTAYTNSTAACGYTNVENLARLQRALQGKAFDAVKSRLLLPACVPQVMSTLYMLYGRPELIIQTLLDKVRETPAPKADRLETLITFGMAVQNLCDHIEATGQMAHLCNPVLLRELVDKVPAQQRLNWALYKQQFATADLRTFAGFMSMLVAAASDVTVTTDFKQSRSGRGERERSRDKSYLNTHAASEPTMKQGSPEQVPKKSEVKEVLCLACNGRNHKVKDCATFKGWEVDSRWNTIQDHHLCRTCLGKHGRRPCKIQVVCGVEGCQQRHHRLLHSSAQNQGPPTKDGQNTAKQCNTSEEGLNAHHATKKATLFRILPVTLTWKDKSVETFAFLDDGSDMTLVEQSIADRLGIDDGEPLPLCLTWTSNVTRQEPKSQRVHLKISGKGKYEQFTLKDARTVSSLNLPKQTLKYGELARHYTHLRGLPVTSYEGATPGILIGSNNASLTATLSLREGQLGDPLASKTRLGWSIYGYTSEGEKATNFMLHVCECRREYQVDQDLHELVKQHFTVESIGVSADKGPESEEDKRSRRILEETTKRILNRFETGLLWRHDHVEFPNSFPMAMRRLQCFERRMQKDPELHASVQRQISEYLKNDYIHEVTKNEMESMDSKKVWYLPLGAVRNPKKPGKIRLVWDAAAKVGGVSFNSMLLKGPDLLTPLASVLCKFRERPVAVCGDLKQMFHQFRIRQEDAQSQRFLYREHPSQPVRTFVMDVGTFGATCSPCQAQYIKNRNAAENEEEFPEAAEAIKEKHYVDDYLDSFDTEEEAIKVALEVMEVHARGGFCIRNWHSNSDALLKRVGEPCADQPKAISIDSESGAERVLGLLWLPKEDIIAFSSNQQLPDIAPTKRNILRCVMSLFDSQGILSHITIQGRMIIQDTWRNQTQWDEEVAEAIRLRWFRWIKLFEEVGQIRLHRSYFPGFTSAEVGSVELHVFTDASEEAFACTAYFRATIMGRVHVALVMAKAKVAPLKSLSVPRLELMGALLGARLAKAVKEYHTLLIVRRVMWTDSKTTLAWIQSQHRRYRQFVAFRVGEILDKTEATEWRYVPTQHNPADDATKWGKGPSPDVTSRWFRGPDFLYSPESEWPEQKSTQSLETDEELRPCMVHREKPIEDVYQIGNFSKWERLLRAAAYVRRYIANCYHKSKRQELVTGFLNQEELQNAENSLWRSVQASAYPNEVAVLTERNQKKRIEKTSPVHKLCPFLDEHGVMRVDSRIGAVPYVMYDFKFPIILPRHHHLTKLIIDWYHRRYLHANHATVLNEVRQRFHVSSLRTVIRQVIKECQTCKIAKAAPVPPRMAPLPEARLAAMVRPFSYVGLDYFGPVQVRIGRSCVKRWVALFTCLTVRAVHLEVVHSLSTESCKMAVRRFVARRGSPLEIRSDNGTNFQGASRELRDQITAIDQQLAETFTNSNTKWIFNPPSAPHFGGSWERLVRSVKVALGSLCSERNPDEETLWTVITEAESIVNSRPLTSIPLESMDQEALTPNHFILLSSSGVTQPPTKLAEPTKVTRTNWNMARQLLDQFWRRWINEYLPTIAVRSKWFEEVEKLRVNDLVLIVDEGQRNGWLRGRVLAVNPGSDGRIRQATVQTPGGILRRPVSKLAVLQVQGDRNADATEDSQVRYGSGNVANAGSTENLNGESIDDTPQSDSMRSD
ncbi:uncharacterized protein LOC134285727 [Aedes albopictus]|uniref:Endonuclease n=1 Tax=Aedes albopictus TaxID=7160 RepID=A0ABM1Y578_AEDAL